MMGTQPLPQIRTDLQFTLHQHGQQYWYSVHNPLNGQFFRLGPREYTLACLMRRSRSIDQLCQQIEQDADLSARLGKPVQASEIVQLANWLMRNGLTETGTVAQTNSPYRRWILNPLSMRFPIIPGHLLESWCRPIAPYLNAGVGIGILVAYLLACICVIADWDSFSQTSAGLFVSDSKLYWGFAWLILKVAHEFGHALATVRVNSQIRAAGMNVIFFAPIPYVDVSDLWTISNRWQRIACSAAGMLAEMTLAALAVLVGTFTEAETLKYFCCAIAVTGTVTTIVFNANPLMRFDGYFILSDLLGLPNLWTQAQNALNKTLGRCCFPWKYTGQTWPSLSLACYGALTLVYRTLMMVTLAATAILIWQSVGVIVVVWATYAIYIHPYLKSLRQEQLARQEAKLNFNWLEKAWSSLAIAALASALFLIPSPIQPAAPGVVAYFETTQIHAETTGILVEVPVAVGSRVEAGQTIAVLSDTDLQLELTKKQLEKQAIEESLRAQQARGNLADLQTAEAKLISLETQVNQLQSRVEHLTIVAAKSGTIVSLSVENSLGQKVSAGDSICVLAPTGELEAVVSASQRDLADFAGAVGVAVLVKNYSGCRGQGTVQQVNTQGSQYLSEPLLAGCYDGPITVEAAPTTESKPNQWRMLAPRFDVHVRLPSESDFVPGQLVWVRVPRQSASVGSVVLDWIASHWQSLKHGVSAI